MGLDVSNLNSDWRQPYCGTADGYYLHKIRWVIILLIRK